MSENNNNDRPAGWQADEINAAFTATEIKFSSSNADILAAFKNDGQREVVFDDSGKPFARYDNEILPLHDALVRWAADAPDGTCDRRTLPRSPGGGRRGIASKADLKTTKDKTDYINKFGYDAFAALPSKAAPTAELRFRDQFYQLPVSEKVRLIGQYGEDFIRSLPARPTNQPFGGYVNHTALEKQKQIRGRSAR